MKILLIASECVPFCKTGGLADVVGALAPVLAARGHEVSVMLPLYAVIDHEKLPDMTHAADFEVELGWRRQYCGVEKLPMNGVNYYFIDNKYYFGRSYMYGLGGDEYERFAFFCRGALNALQIIGLQPDIIHVHDWQTGMIPALLKTQYHHLPFYAGIKTVFTIHNLQYQGVFGIPEVQDVLGVDRETVECCGSANYMKAALAYADEITTVSPSYAEEIQTSYYGERLDGLLRARRDRLSGVLNGIDIGEYDPARDRMIAQTYAADNTEGKAVCKRALQTELGLDVSPDTPIIAMIGRLSGQKGLDLVDRVIAEIMGENIQLIVLGLGEAKYFNLFSWCEQNYPGRMAARFRMDGALAHRIYAGADIFLMPSQFEPCGLSQMIAMRYGMVPVVRETGGLRDTVLSLNEYTGEGNGFTFFNYNAHDMLYVIRRAVRTYRESPDVWRTLMKRGMTGDYSWDRSAGKYLSLYESLLDAPKTPGKESGGEKDAPKKQPAPRRRRPTDKKE